MRKLVGLTAGVALAVVLTGPAFAAKPANQACLGHDVREDAKAGADFGHFVAGIATEDRGIGEEVQLLLAGAIPDEAEPNSCND